MVSKDRGNTFWFEDLLELKKIYKEARKLDL